MGWFDDNEDYYIYQQYWENNKEEIRSSIPCKNGTGCSFARKGNCWFFHKEGQAERKVLKIPELKDTVTVLKLEKFEDWTQAPEIKEGIRNFLECEFGEDYEEDEEEETEESEDEEEVDRYIFEEDMKLIQEMFDDERDFYTCLGVEEGVPKKEFSDKEGYMEEEEEDVWFAFVKELQNPTLCKKVLARGWKCNKKLKCIMCTKLSDEYYNREEYIEADHGDEECLSESEETDMESDDEEEFDEDDEEEFDEEDESDSSEVECDETV